MGTAGNILFIIWNRQTGEVPQNNRRSLQNNTNVKQCCVPILSNVARIPGKGREKFWNLLNTYEVCLTFGGLSLYFWVLCDSH